MTVLNFWRLRSSSITKCTYCWFTFLCSWKKCSMYCVMFIVIPEFFKGNCLKADFRSNIMKIMQSTKVLKSGNTRLDNSLWIVLLFSDTFFCLCFVKICIIHTLYFYYSILLFIFEERLQVLWNYCFRLGLSCHWSKMNNCYSIYCSFVIDDIYDT